MIHPSAIVDEAAQLAADVSVGPYAVVGAGAKVGGGTRIGAHVVLEGDVSVGAACELHPFSVIGGAPQDKKYAGEPTRVEIGERTVIREYCTVNRGTQGGGGVTRIGSDNWIMAYVHVAHDCVVGNHIIMANATTLAGHAQVADHVIFGAFTVVHQFCAIGAHAFTAMGTVVFQDVPPYVTAAGNKAEAKGLNVEGLKRRGFDTATIAELRRAYKVIYRQGLRREQAIEVLRERVAACPEIAPLVEFLGNTTRGIVR